MENNFSKIMKSRSDFELIEIVTKLRNDYKPDAILAAEQEIEIRKLSINDVENAKIQIKINEENIIKKAEEPLELHWKALTFLLPGIINIFIAGALKADGYDKKFKEVWKFTLFGLIFYAILVVFIFIFFILFYKLQLIQIG